MNYPSHPLAELNRSAVSLESPRLELSQPANNIVRFNRPNLLPQPANNIVRFNRPNLGFRGSIPSSLSVNSLPKSQLLNRVVSGLGTTANVLSLITTVADLAEQFIAPKWFDWLESFTGYKFGRLPVITTAFRGANTDNKTYWIWFRAVVNNSLYERMVSAIGPIRWISKRAALIECGSSTEVFAYVQGSFYYSFPSNRCYDFGSVFEDAQGRKKVVFVTANWYVHSGDVQHYSFLILNPDERSGLVPNPQEFTETAPAINYSYVVSPRSLPVTIPEEIKQPVKSPIFPITPPTLNPPAKTVTTPAKIPVPIAPGERDESSSWTQITSIPPYLNPERTTENPPQTVAEIGTEILRITELLTRSLLKECPSPCPPCEGGSKVEQPSFTSLLYLDSTSEGCQIQSTQIREDALPSAVIQKINDTTRFAAKFCGELPVVAYDDGLDPQPKPSVPTLKVIYKRKPPRGYYPLSIPNWILGKEDTESFEFPVIQKGGNKLLKVEFPNGTYLRIFSSTFEQAEMVWQIVSMGVDYQQANSAVLKKIETSTNHQSVAVYPYKAEFWDGTNRTHPAWAIWIETA